MSNQHATPQVNRVELIEEVIRAIRENSSMAIFFHTFISEQIGLGATEEKTMLILRSAGPLTAGEIAQRTGLTTPSVTNLIDRLEGKGFVQRIRDSHDRRRVIVQVNEERHGDLNRLFAPLQEKFAEVIEAYDNEQLETIRDFLTQATRWSREYIDTLQQKKEALE